MVSYVVICGILLIVVVLIYSVEGLVGMGGWIVFGLIVDVFGSYGWLYFGLFVIGIGVFLIVMMFCLFVKVWLEMVIV